jgi:MarR family transcriptional regulator, transcriptional regulator for hemolysin
MPQKPYDPERSIGALITDLSRLVRRTFNRHLRDSELTQSQWQAIAYLRRWEGINQAALAELMEIQPITLARLIDRMTAAGWVERRPDPNDRRAVRLFLTDKAQPILANMRAAGTLFQEQALAGVDADERQQLIGLLGRIKTNLSHSAEITRPAGAPKARGTAKARTLAKPRTDSASTRAGTAAPSTK